MNAPNIQSGHDTTTSSSYRLEGRADSVVITAVRIESTLLEEVYSVSNRMRSSHSSTRHSFQCLYILTIKCYTFLLTIRWSFAVSKANTKSAAIIIPLTLATEQCDDKVAYA